MDKETTRNTGSNGTDASGRGLTRRGYLLGTAGVLGAGMLLSDRSQPVAASTEALTMDVPSAYLERFGTVVDMTVVGADPQGREPIDDLLRQYVGDDTLLVFPQGRYLMNKQLRKTGFDNLGFYGPDATITHGRIDAVSGNSVTAGEFTGPSRLFRLGVIYAPGKDLLFEGLTFDYTARNSGLRAIEAYVTDGLEVRDITIEGQHDTGTLGPALFSITAANGTGVVERFKAPDGAAFSENTLGDIWVGPTGMLIDPYSAGTLRIVDCELGCFPDNGLYVSGPHGTVHVEGGVYKNSNVCSIRLKGHGTSVRGATVVVDDALDGRAQRGIRLDEGSDLGVYDTTIHLVDPNGDAIRVRDDVETGRIENCTIVMETTEANRGIHVTEGAGRIEIVDTSIEMHGADNAVRILGKNDWTDDPVLLKNVTITGDASGRVAREAIRAERANCRFDDLTVQQPGPDYRRAIEVIGDDNLVTGGTYESSHIPIINRGNRTRIDGVIAQSYDGYQAVKLYDAGGEVVIEDCVLYGGYSDGGVDDLVVQSTTFPPV